MAIPPQNLGHVFAQNGSLSNSPDSLTTVLNCNGFLNPSHRIVTFGNSKPGSM